MGGTRALFASIGVSVSLVAAAALSLFAVSVVIAFGGWSAGIGESAMPPALVVGDAAPAQARDVTGRFAASRPVVLHAPAHRRPRTRPATAPARRVPSVARRADAVVRRPVTVASRPPVVTVGTTRPPAPAPPAVAHKPTTGDGVRDVGDGLSSTVQSTGDALSDATAPLGPPVSAAVQKVLDLVAAALQRTTNGLGGTLDKLGR